MSAWAPACLSGDAFRVDYARVFLPAPGDIQPVHHAVCLHRFVAELERVGERDDHVR
ncbi:MAG: hypothetical protein KJZ97_11070 [Burkholderiaceae bacterium]|nr:hypothetical protein [Burkholderiaceae bacterium]